MGNQGPMMRVVGMDACICVFVFVRVRVCVFPYVARQLLG
jgi:hypothetical protein